MPHKSFGVHLLKIWLGNSELTYITAVYRELVAGFALRSKAKNPTMEILIWIPLKVSATSASSAPSLAPIEDIFYDHLERMINTVPKLN